MHHKLLGTVLMALTVGACATARPAVSAPPQETAFNQPPSESGVEWARARPSRSTGPLMGVASPQEWQAWGRSHGGVKKTPPKVGQVALFGVHPGSARWAGRVERVDTDGTVLLAMKMRGQWVRLRMNLSQPSVRRHPTTHRVLNHYLAPADAGKSPKTTAQLYLGWVPAPSAPALVADAR